MRSSRKLHIFRVKINKKKANKIRDSELHSNEKYVQAFEITFTIIFNIVNEAYFKYTYSVDV